MTSKTVTVYGLSIDNNIGSTDPNVYIIRESKDELEEYLSDRWTTIVEIEVTFKFPEPELPTTPGSVVRAKTEYSGLILWGLSADEDGEPWYGLSNGVQYAEREELTNVEVLFDAATIN